MSTGRRAYNILRGYVGREWDRIQSVEATIGEAELLEYLPPATQAETNLQPSAVPKLSRLEHARRILGVAEGATFASIRQAFQRLNERSDPKKFPTGSAEATQAAEIQRKVQWAYQLLTEDVDPTEKRFGSLEV